MKKFKNIWVRIVVFLKDKNKKGYFQILKEVFQLFKLKKEFPLYYFAKFLYRKEITKAQDYLSIKEMKKVVAYGASGSKNEYDLIRNKYKFEKFLKKHHLKTTTTLAYVKKGKLSYEDTVFNLFNNEEFNLVFKKIFSGNDRTQIFIKPFSAQGGKDCFILNEPLLQSNLPYYTSIFCSGSYIIQEIIHQHPMIAKINKSCINSLRFNSYLDASGEAKILSAFMRFGRDGSPVDNGSSGGFYVAVDLNDGTLNNEGKQLMRFGGNVFNSHPDTHFDFSNFEIPHFPNACLLVKQASELLTYNMLGWDIAISEDGPIIIEANDNFSIFVADIAYGGLLTHSLIKNIINKPDV